MNTANAKTATPFGYHVVTDKDGKNPVIVEAPSRAAAIIAIYDPQVRTATPRDMVGVDPASIVVYKGRKPTKAEQA